MLAIVVVYINTNQSVCKSFISLLLHTLDSNVSTLSLSYCPE
jgi:hypothetical protein